jgi:hypothetical protein
MARLSSSHPIIAVPYPARSARYCEPTIRSAPSNPLLPGSSRATGRSDSPGGPVAGAQAVVVFGRVEIGDAAGIVDLDAQQLARMEIEELA